MSIFSEWRTRRAVERLSEERLFEIVYDEIEEGEIRNGLWAKALSASQGDEAKTKAAYISLRMQSMRDEFEITSSSFANNHRKTGEPSETEKRSNIKSKQKKPKTGHRGFCNRCGKKTNINYGDAYQSLCKDCAYAYP